MDITDIFATDSNSNVKEELVLDSTDKDDYNKWKGGEISVWKLLRSFLLKRDIKGCKEVIKTLESLMVPKELYKELYVYISHMALNYGEFDLFKWITSNKVLGSHRSIASEMKKLADDLFTIMRRNSFINSDDAIYKYYNDTNMEINQYILNIFIDREDGVKKYKDSIENNDLNDFKELIEAEENTIFACYIAGLSNKRDFIDVAVKYNPSITLKAMIEVDSEFINSYKEHINYTLKKELLIGSYNDLYIELFGLSRPFYDILLNSNTNMMKRLFLNSIHLQPDITDVKSVEAYAVYMHMFVPKYKRLIEDLTPVRYHIPENIVEVMMKMEEENRYLIYIYSLDNRLNDIDIIKNTNELLLVRNAYYLPSDNSGGPFAGYWNLIYRAIGDDVITLFPSNNMSERSVAYLHRNKSKIDKKDESKVDNSKLYLIIFFILIIVALLVVGFVVKKFNLFKIAKFQTKELV